MPQGVVAIDNTRAAVAQELGMDRIPVGIWNTSDPLPRSTTENGTKSNQVIDVVGENGKTIPVNTAWMVGEDGIPKLVTATPAKK